MKLVFAGTPEFARVALEALHQAGHEIALVLTQPDRPAGRGMKLQASPVKQWAQSHELPVCQPLSLRLDGKYPEDARLAQRADLSLKQTYQRECKTLRRRASGYAHAKQFKRANRSLRKLRTYLGRVIRDIARVFGAFGNPQFGYLPTLATRDGEKLSLLIREGNAEGDILVATHNGDRRPLTDAGLGQVLRANRAGAREWAGLLAQSDAKTKRAWKSFRAKQTAKVLKAKLP